jgi:branched-chain amino acid transport system ATP-binding protein
VVLLTVNDIFVQYDGVSVLNGISIDAPEGSVTTIIGANGAGKTTTLRAISGLVPLKSGEIWFQGTRLDGEKPQRVVGRGVTHVPEGRGLFPWMSTYENLLTGAWNRRDKKEMLSDLDKVYDYFPVLKKSRNKLARNMSGGEQQMLAIGRALMARPRLYLLDEPSMGLAPMLVETVLETIRRIAKDQAVGVVLVEQNASLALEVADTAYVLELGKVVLKGNAEQIKSNPEVRRVYLGV